MLGYKGYRKQHVKGYHGLWNDNFTQAAHKELMIRQLYRRGRPLRGGKPSLTSVEGICGVGSGPRRGNLEKEILACRLAAFLSAIFDKNKGVGAH